MAYILPFELQEHTRVNDSIVSVEKCAKLADARSARVRNEEAVAREISVLQEICETFAASLNIADAEALLRESQKRLESLTANDAPLRLRAQESLTKISAVIFSRAAAREQNARLANQDELTGLPNLRAFRAELIRQLAARRKETAPSAVFYLNIDDFAALNRRIGYANGDLILREFAELLREKASSTRMFARAHDDIFLALVTEISREHSNIFAEDLQAALETHIFTLDEGAQANIRVSVGVANYPHDGETIDALLARAAHRSHKQRAARSRQMPLGIFTAPALPISNLPASNVLPFSRR
jgi:diguanylate cyclase (GGDEF)-like protein